MKSYAEWASQAAVAQLVARRSHNPKVVSSILTCRIYFHTSKTPSGIHLWRKGPNPRERYVIPPAVLKEILKTVRTPAHRGPRLPPILAAQNFPILTARTSFRSRQCAILANSDPACAKRQEILRMRHLPQTAPNLVHAEENADPSASQLFLSRARIPFLPN